MTGLLRLSTIASAAALLAIGAFAQQAVMEEVRVEASFSSGLQLQRPNPAIDELLKRLELRDQQRRELELKEANKNSATKVIELLKLPAWVPFGFGASENKVDSFFQQNYMRADLNPRKENPLFTAE
ncbi:MAG TPA: hypothetical protein VK993_14160 [Chthoniobacterales bacterium]|nr:hypothetical protein [Chthoniobacterales bacterium]